MTADQSRNMQFCFISLIHTISQTNIVVLFTAHPPSHQCLCLRYRPSASIQSGSIKLFGTGSGNVVIWNNFEKHGAVFTIYSPPLKVDYNDTQLDKTVPTFFVNDDQQDANIQVYLFIPSQLYMFRAMSSSIIRST